MEQLLVTIHDGTAFVQAVERGTFRLSNSLKEFGNEAINRNVGGLVIDMSRCYGMDSTFMGVIAGLALRLKQKNKGRVLMVELTRRTRGLLSTLGLDQLVRAYMAGQTPKEILAVFSGKSDELADISKEEPSREQQAKMMLEAHQNLVDLSPDNLPRFKDVLTFLKEDIKSFGNEQDQGSPKPDGP